MTRMSPPHSFFSPIITIVQIPHMKHRTSLSFALLIAVLWGAGCTPPSSVPQILQTPSSTSVSQQEVALDNKDAEDAVENFLTQGPLSQWMDGKIFASYFILGEEHAGATTTRYIWANIESFTNEQGKVELKSGFSGPIALTIIRRDDKEAVVGHQVPRDGNLYGPDIRKIFPQNIQDKIFHKPGVPLPDLEQRNHTQAKQYFSTLK